MARGKKADLARWLAEHQPGQVGESEFNQIRSELAPISESYLRKLLRESGVPLHPLAGGVRQESFDHLEQSLLALAGFYEHGDPKRKLAVRRLVIIAKEHARLAARAKRASPEKRREKEEVVLWLATWLENPPLFADWVRLRKHVLGT
jgi:hypothetical protein